MDTTIINKYVAKFGRVPIYSNIASKSLCSLHGISVVGPHRQ